jgi:hypothetical protein
MKGKTNKNLTNEKAGAANTGFALVGGQCWHTVFGFKSPLTESPKPLTAIMKTSLICIVMFLAGCTFETHVSGVVVDERTGLPVKDVLVGTIKDVNGRELEFAETKTSTDGHFDLRFSTKTARDNEVSVELSKRGYQTNMYTCYHEKANDTLVLRRQ